MALEGKVKEIIAEQLGIAEDEIQPDCSFVEDLGADSLDILELIMAFEEEFEIEISDEEAEKLETFSDLVHFLEHRN